jgi:hypothetical protein
MTDVDTIGFGCPHCRTALTVPASASGAKGPCPQCGSVIQAPTFLMVHLPMIVEASLTYPPAPLPERTLAAPVEEERLQLPAPVENSDAVSADERLLPAPADTPNLSSTRDREQRELLRKAAMIIGLATLGLAAAIAISLNKDRPEKPVATAAPAEVPPVAPAPPPAPAEIKPVAVAEKPPARPPEPVVPRGVDVPALIRQSSLVLGEFLEAGDLRIRLLMIETKTPVTDLDSGILAKPLPAVKATEALGVTFDQAADTADVLFRVDFEPAPGEIDPQLILLRKRGNLEPKIVADPFLDGYGGRLQKFLTAPTFGTQEFQSLITVNEFTQSKEVPDPAGKSPVVIAISQRGRPLAIAYFPKVSALSDKLVLKGVKSGNEIPATYTLHWNTTEDPALPYIELIDVTSLKW